MARHVSSPGQRLAPSELRWRKSIINTVMFRCSGHALALEVCLATGLGRMDGWVDEWTCDGLRMEGVRRKLVGDENALGGQWFETDEI